MKTIVTFTYKTEEKICFFSTEIDPLANNDSSHILKTSIGDFDKRRILDGPSYEWIEEDDKPEDQQNLWKP